MPSVKKLRSKIPRRKRVPLLPISTKGNLGEQEEDTSAVTASASSSCFPGEISNDKSLKCDQNPKRRWQSKPSEVKIGRSGSAERSRPEKRRFLAADVFLANDSRPITRSYYKWKENLKSAPSESSGVDSLSGIDVGKPEGAPDKDSKQTIASSEGTANAASVITFSEGDRCVSGFAPPSELLPDCTCHSSGKPTAPAPSKISRNCALEESVPEPKPDDDCESEFFSDLACSEQLSSDDDESSDYLTCSEFGSDSSCYLSALSKSPGEFSERSPCEPVPASYRLFHTYAQLLIHSGFHHEKQRGPSDLTEDNCSDEFTHLSFENDEDEESYLMLRRRERSHALLHDYAEEYCRTTDYGDLIVDQRLLMINWMVEHARVNRLQCETLFLGVSMLDRFLSKCFFKSDRNLQILGVSCITLATRIEENQPFNSVRVKAFKVGNNVYSRCEVVAMEWLVQDVLRFSCFIPTTYNFLWFCLKAAKVEVEVENLAKYMAVMSLLDHERLRFWPSTVAAGLLFLASSFTYNNDSCQWLKKSLQWLVKYA
ncbi:Cyclin-SDS-like [Acorus calamus]|uniref:Cyclin-SDS-like n=1 Tax=Acorus calamus TaxID=4465 RepID=A0AAV9DN97_ACOCL|nr:Cyclin-SDS-like [Acorus calamus]